MREMLCAKACCLVVACDFGWRLVRIICSVVEARTTLIDDLAVVPFVKWPLLYCSFQYFTQSPASSIAQAPRVLFRGVGGRRT